MGKGTENFGIEQNFCSYSSSCVTGPRELGACVSTAPHSCRKPLKFPGWSPCGSGWLSGCACWERMEQHGASLTP